MALFRATNKKKRTVKKNTLFFILFYYQHKINLFNFSDIEFNQINLKINKKLPNYDI